MNLFFGKISTKYDIQQISGGYYKSDKNSSWFGGIQIGDYAFIIGGGKIQLWQAREWGQKDGQDCLYFDIIFKEVPIRIKEFVAFKFFELNVNLIIKTTKSTAKEYKAFFKITLGQEFSEDLLLDLDTYKDKSNYRAINLLSSKNMVQSNTYNIQLYFEDSDLKIAPIKHSDPLITNNFRNNLPFINKGQSNKDKTLAIVKYQQNLGTSIGTKVSIMQLYEAFMCPYVVKKSTTKYWVVNGFDKERIDYCLEHSTFIMQFQYNDQPSNRVTTQLQEACKIKEGDKVLLYNENRYYAHGTFVKADAAFTKTTSLKEQIKEGTQNNLEEIIGFKDAPCYYEDLTKNNGFNGKWGQRLCLDEWSDIKEDGIHIPGIMKSLDGFIQNTILQLKNQAFYEQVVDSLSEEIDITTDNKIEEHLQLLKHKFQIILQGPPGTGKTYRAMNMAEKMIFNKISKDKEEQYTKMVTSDRFKLIQFHPSYTYEDFIRGISAMTNEKNDIIYKTENKILSVFANQAASDPDNDYVLIIDEINRANLPNVLGELIFALEYRGRKVASMYAIDNDNSIFLPSNLYIIGTMNTADRSIGHIDYAIKRRFAFVNILAKESVIEFPKAKELFQKVAKLFVESENGQLKNSSFLAPDFDYKDVQLGHSYFLVDNDADLKIRLNYEIIPILNEYIKDGLLLETAKDYIHQNLVDFV